MKTLVIALLSIFSVLPANAGELKHDPKAVTLYAFVQCREPLFIMLVGSDGTSTLLDLDDVTAVSTVLKQVPPDQRFRVNLPDPENGCPLTT